MKSPKNWSVSSSEGLRDIENAMKTDYFVKDMSFYHRTFLKILTHFQSLYNFQKMKRINFLDSFSKNVTVFAPKSFRKYSYRKKIRKLFFVIIFWFSPWYFFVCKSICKMHNILCLMLHYSLYISYYFWNLKNLIMKLWMMKYLKNS